MYSYKLGSLIPGNRWPQIYPLDAVSALASQYTGVADITSFLQPLITSTSQGIGFTSEVPLSGTAFPLTYRDMHYLVIDLAGQHVLYCVHDSKLVELWESLPPFTQYMIDHGDLFGASNTQLPTLLLRNLPNLSKRKIELFIKEQSN